MFKRIKEMLKSFIKSQNRIAIEPSHGVVRYIKVWDYERNEYVYLTIYEA